MSKKFVSLNCNVSPSNDPYQIKTYNAPSYEKIQTDNVDPCCFRNPDIPDCPQWPLTAPRRRTKQQKTPSITVEDEIFNLYRKVQASRVARDLKKKCNATDIFTECVKLQRTPAELKSHAEMREKYLKAQRDFKSRVHDAGERLSEGPSLIQLESLVFSADKKDSGEVEEEGDHVRPKVASPPCSSFYVPSKKFLDLKRPKSGIFINDTELPAIKGLPVPYSTYNPRKLQEQLDNQKVDKYFVLEGDRKDLYTWNIGQTDLNGSPIVDTNRLYSREEENRRERDECVHFEPKIFPIPKDLHQTFLFTAEMVFGNGALKPVEMPISFHRPKEIACLYVAYVESFIINPDIWNAETMDQILVEGQRLHAKSLEYDYENSEMDFDIIPEIAEKAATIALKLHFTGSLNEEPNILKSLTLFFMKYTAAILCSTNVFLLIWKRCQKSFYIFDPNGRNEHCQRNFQNGKCSLIATVTVEHIVHLVLNYSGVDRADDFHLYELRLVNFGKINCPLELGQPRPKRKLFAVVNRFFAIIPAAETGLKPPSSGIEVNASVMTAFMVLLYAELDPPRYWQVRIIEDLIRYGKKCFREFISDHNIPEGHLLNIADFPDTIIIGTYRAVIKKRPFVQTGHLTNCRSYRESQLTTALREFFCCQGNSAVLQVDNSAMALWRDSYYYYCFDPFQRGRAGQVLAKRRSRGVGCLQLHITLDSVCRILYRNALEMRKGGKFFLHGVEVESIGPFVPTKAALEAAKFGHLFIKYPLDCLTERKCEEAAPTPELDLEDNEDFPGSALPGCLSNLSVSPCQRTCSERDFIAHLESMEKRKKKDQKLRRSYSVQSIPEKYRIPEYDTVDIVDGLVAEFLCNVMTHVKRRTEKRARDNIEASKVLLTSDMEHLQTMKVHLQRGLDYDNICESLRRTPHLAPPLSVEDEIALPSNFQTQSDGSWAIFSKSRVENADEYISQFAGILSALVATALTAKYKISTWSREVIEYAVESTGTLAGIFESYDQTISTILAKNIPKLQIGSRKYQLAVQHVMRNSVGDCPLKKLLEDALLYYDRLLVICKKFSCVIVRRYNFFYLFVGYPCDSVGFRNVRSGPACLMRFVDLGPLLRRIEFGCAPASQCPAASYVVIALNVTDVSDDVANRILQLSKSEESILYAKETDKQKKKSERIQEKMSFLNSEIRKETERIDKFHKMKAAKKDKKKEQLVVRLSNAQEQNAEEEENAINDDGQHQREEQMEEMEVVEFKHKPGTKVRSHWRDDLLDGSPILGYQFRDQDCLFKIQGTTSLEGRMEMSHDHIQPCFFASVLAVLFAVLKPLGQWDFMRVDKVIQNAIKLTETVTNMNTSFERIIKNITVDEFIFQVIVRTYEHPGCSTSTRIEHIIESTSRNRRYFLLQIPNGTFAIFRDEYYHLFDPYASMDVVAKTKSDETTVECPDHIRKNPERNSASWILFSDVEAMLKYIGDRATSQKWKKEIQMHVVDVMSYKKAPQRIQLQNLLANEFVTCSKSVTNEEVIMCAHPEEINWLDNCPNKLTWSRMNQLNADGKVRGHPLAKSNNFDIEISGRLWSLWGSIHPAAVVFEENSRGKQYLAVNVIACCVANVYQLDKWNSQLLDAIVINGDKYHRESVEDIQRKDYELSPEDLNTECTMDNLWFNVHLEYFVYGQLYSQTKNEMNLTSAVKYFFKNNRYGVLQCHRRSLAFGRTADEVFFMFDCQTKGLPLFPKGQGAAYVLRTNRLQVLLYCMVMTLNVPFYHIQFTIHKVEMITDKDQYEEEDDKIGEY